MAKTRVERRLAAILAADVAGYSSLMGVDGEGTLAALKAYRRKLVDPKIAEHRGRIVKTTGDGALVAFGSAVNSAIGGKADIKTWRRHACFLSRSRPNTDRQCRASVRAALLMPLKRTARR